MHLESSFAEEKKTQFNICSDELIISSHQEPRMLIQYLEKIFQYIPAFAYEQMSIA